MSALQTCILVLAFAACTLALGPVYQLAESANIGATLTVNNEADQSAKNLTTDPAGRHYQFFSDVEYYEWQGYDGWFNNPAHPEWGGAGK